SSSGYAFLAIVAHYVTNSGKLSAQLTFMFNYVTHFMPQETMIDFRELIGDHSGDDMAEAVWETIYGRKPRIRP
ncbi:hypothetical protein B0H14DRAFT_2353964, partial [Mycena olivaceomarginata]